ncbi:hypothetical protein QR680_016034 [Steinernema hermaphroditum]|uniref:Hexosyltransferase n=1 Tax=Steinernema hermaphroditum TaxID=289476 RepID=A0AA39LL93_9BILA|nr:hypothetical protein QR680_016034 [Steinernema hermaphroditum]
MRVLSPRFVLTFTTVLLIQILLFLFWHGQKLKRFANGHDQVNVTFANCQFEYEVLTDFDANRCKGKELFVFVMSAASSFEHRNTIRQTWAEKRHTVDSLVVFIVGTEGNEDNNKLLKEENKRYGDIIETTIPDAYNYTALKIHAGYYLHVTYCSNVPFVLRVNDDVIVLLDRVVHLIKTGYFGSEEKAIYGIVWRDGKPMRDPGHKWYIPPEYYNSDTYPPYVNGAAYLMTRESPKAILEKTKEANFFWIEDVLFTGIMANATGVKLIDANGVFKYHCDQEEEAGRHAFRSWGDAGFCLLETSPCDSHGVPYAAVIYHSPDNKYSNMERGDNLFLFYLEMRISGRIFADLAAMHIVVVYWYLISAALLVSSTYAADGSAKRINRITKWKSPVVKMDFANYHREYRYFHPPNATRCDRKNLFIFIISAIPSFDRRQLTRKTWAQAKHVRHASVWFVIGRPENNKQKASVIREHQKNDDLLWVDVGDGYNDTALKVYAGYRAYATFCSGATHILRVDDDVVLLPDRMQHLISTGYLGHDERAAYGILWEAGSIVVRDPTNKWYVSRSHYAPDTYPDYLNGPVYLITGDAVKAILKKTVDVRFFWIEDILFTGLMTKITETVLVDASKIFVFACVTDDASWPLWNRMGICLEERAHCDDYGVPQATIVSHAPVRSYTDITDTYYRLLNVKCKM